MIDPRRAVVRLTEEDLARRLALPAGVHVHTMRHRYDLDLYELLVTAPQLAEVQPGDEGPVVDADLLTAAPVRDRQVTRLGDVFLAAEGTDSVDAAYLRQALAELLGVDQADNGAELDSYVLIRS